MTAALRFMPVYKEARALLIPWLVCLVLVILPSVLNLRLTPIAVFAYCIGTAALGALSIGHEYTDRTLSLLLTLPVHRARLLGVKQAVVAVLLIVLWLIVHTNALNYRIPSQWVYTLPLLYGFFLAPAVTLVSRNPIAGTVFSIGLPGMLWVAGEWLGTMLYGTGREMALFRLSIFRYGSVVLCLAGFAITWRTFLTLEAIDGPGLHVPLPQWMRVSAGERAAGLTRRSRTLELVKKELGLQQLPLVLAALHYVGWLAVVLLVADSPLLDAFAVIGALFAVMLSLLIGSTASAGERQLGTAEWQVLMPLHSSAQFAIKAAVTLGLTLLLTLVVPELCASLNPTLDPTRILNPVFAGAIVLLSAGSLYVSSLCRSALWALLMSILTAFGAGLYLDALMRWFGPQALFSPGAATLPCLAGLVGVLLWFAHANHRSADQTLGRSWAQAITIVAVATAMFVIAMNVQSGYR